MGKFVERFGHLENATRRIPRNQSLSPSAGSETTASGSICSNRAVEFIGHGLDDLEDSPTDLYLARIPSLAAWRLLPEDDLWRRVVEEPGAAGCALFIAGDWRSATSEIREFASYCFSHGIFWVSTWGPGCEEAHDLFDWADLEAKDPSTDSVVMTTWHADEPLHVAMTLFFIAFPDRAMLAGPARIALNFGEPDWSDAIRRLARHEADRSL